MKITIELETAIKAALEAGNAIMEIYKQEDFEVEDKADESPLTIADKKANDIINGFLEPTGVPIISEENKQIAYKDRKGWTQCWIVDPLDGTKEFIKRNGEFTVNIALISNGRPMAGVIYAPAIDVLYFGDVAQEKAYKVEVEGESSLKKLFEKAAIIKPSQGGSTIRVVGSRSHMNTDTLDFVEKLKQDHAREVEIVSRGSSLKFCLVAEGSADIYPRYAPTMEWDTAAGQAICEAVGLKVVFRKSGEAIRYNRENLLNEHFLVSNEGQNL